jgi:D-beta-D-heptose 7-phosphate kinase/D-beta-D-heptose 1-phosphate adenosyltransferase
MRRREAPRARATRAKAILKRFPDQRILVVGDLMLDRYIYGHVTRISPEAPVPVVRFRSEHVRLGGAANVAHNIAALGGRAALRAARRRLEKNEELLSSTLGLHYKHH